MNRRHIQHSHWRNTQQYWLAKTKSDFCSIYRDSHDVETSSHFTNITWFCGSSSSDALRLMTWNMEQSRIRLKQTLFGRVRGLGNPSSLYHANEYSVKDTFNYTCDVQSIFDSTNADSPGTLKLVQWLHSPNAKVYSFTIEWYIRVKKDPQGWYSWRHGICGHNSQPLYRFNGSRNEPLAQILA